ncbi:tetratricopeptide repeat protein [Saccharothrix variisporea]|uniref:Tetratricopeptide repeat protein n=2 Tax=Saccharothrix variisporea TaxID=543527 RepID=A0A495X839_9PSEU|nr:tetratricopeptide repeat protein [Saccharothrix variisporea]
MSDGRLAPGDLGALVREWRTRALLTQEELADRAGLNVRTIRRLENGALRRPRSTSVRLLIEALALDRAEADLLTTAAAGRAPREPPSGAPRQLPAALAGFTGRDTQLRRLDGFLRADPDEADATAVVAIAGPAGVGKTSLAVHWAHRAARHFPDGQLYVDLRGFDPSGTAVHPSEALRGFLTADGVPPERVPAGTEAQSALYRSRLAGRRVLVLLDNARDADQVRPLLPGGGTCLVLVTSRTPLSGLIAHDGAHPVLLDVLTPTEAQHLLARRLGPRRVAAEPEAVAEIVARCARLPLALAVVAARAAIRPGFPLAGFAAELRESSGLDALSGHDARADLRSVFSWSTNAVSPAAARLFRLLGTHPGPDTSTAAAAALAALPLAEARALLAELADAYLVVEHAPGRYTCHDLLRGHATELARIHDTEQDRRSATLRVLDHYLHTGRAAAALFNPQRTEPALAPPQPGVSPEPVPDYAAALAWFTTEHRALLAAADHAVRTGHHRHAAHLAWAVSGFLDRRGHWEDWIRCQGTALTASRHLGDRALEADAHRNLGRANARLGREDEAYEHYHQALELYRRIDDLGGQARTHTNLALLLEQTQNHAEALSHALQSLSIHRGLNDDGVGHANALNTVGWCYALVGDYRQTLVHCQEAIVLHRTINDRDGEAATWDTLGYAHHHLGNHRQATTCYQAAIRLYRELGDRYYESLSLIHLGDLHNGAGAPTTARENWQRAMHILTDLNHPAATDVQARLQGAVETTPSTTTR